LKKKIILAILNEQFTLPKEDNIVPFVRYSQDEEYTRYVQGMYYVSKNLTNYVNNSASYQFDPNI
jgi:hypothetical protein